MGNVHQFPNTMLARRAKQLSELFLNKGKAQLSTFNHLSIELEKLAQELRKDGPRSGAMQRAFGDDYSRMSGRFLARKGIAPKTVYRTPATWLTVIRGFARELDRDAEQLIVELLTSSPLLDREGETPSGDMTWLEALEEILVPMTKHLTLTVDLVEIFEFIARTGLYLDGENLAVSEYPLGEVGIKSSNPYNPSILNLLPHVSGINYRPITRHQLAISPEDFEETIRDLAPNYWRPSPDLGKVAILGVEEGIRTGVALVMRKNSLKIELALFQWQLANLNFCDANGDRIAAIPMDVDPNLPPNFNASPGDWNEAPPEDCYQKPTDWLPNSVRFHFLDDSDFDHIASELVVRPWAYVDPDLQDPFWSPAHYASDPDEYPTRCPFFTTAGAIEGNLLYAELDEGLDGRLDTLLRRDIERIAKLVNAFRKKGEGIEQAARQRLLEQWGSKPKGEGQ